MKTRPRPLVASFVGGFLFLVISITACVDQPKPKCTVGRGEFAARYTYRSGPEECRSLPGEILGVQAYNEPSPNGAPDLDKVPVAIQAVDVVQQAQRSGFSLERQKVYALGRFLEAEAGEDEICDVTPMATEELTLAAVPADPAKSEEGAFETRAFPARTLRHEWSELRFHVSSAVLGTEFKGRLKRTENGVSCEYDVSAIFPSASCGSPVQGDPSGRKTTKDPSACGSNPSLNPDFLTACLDFRDVEVQGKPTQFVCLPTTPNFASAR